MLTWLHRTTLRQRLTDTKTWLRGWHLHLRLRELLADEIIGLSAKALCLIMGTSLAMILLPLLIPPAFQVLLTSFIMVLVIALMPWMAVPRARLWLALLIGTTVWSLGWLALAMLSLMECRGL